MVKVIIVQNFNEIFREKLMKYNTLGQTDIKVSEICLGSMTWGTKIL